MLNFRWQRLICSGFPALEQSYMDRGRRNITPIGLDGSGIPLGVGPHTHGRLGDGTTE